MKKRYRILSTMLAVLLAVTLLCSCSPASTAKDSSALTQAQSQTGESDEEGTGKVHPMRFVTPGTLPPQADIGLAAVNEKLKADGVDIEVEVIRIPWDAYEQKLNLMISSGEPFELLHVMQDVKNISSLASRNALLPIDDYIDNYPNLRDRFGETEWSAATFDNKTYAVPATWRSFDNVLGAMSVREDLMKKHTDEFPGNDVPAILDLMGEIQADLEVESGMKAYSWPHQLSYPPSWLHRTYDSFPFYVDRNLGIILARQDGTIDSYYESEEFRKDCEVYREMYQRGLVSPDILNFTSDMKIDAVNIGAFLPSETYSYISFPVMEEDIPGAEGAVHFTAPEKPQMVYTLVQNLNAISATSEDPESGLKFLNWLYESKENHDLFHYGIEGTHYTASSENRINHLKDGNNNNLYSFDTWMTGYLPYMRFDERLSEEGIEWENFVAEERAISPIAGFLFDSTNVASELATLQTEIISSIYPLQYGLLEYDSAYPEALERLKAAGLDKYLEEYRAQFKAYLAEHPEAVQ